MSNDRQERPPKPANEDRDVGLRGPAWTAAAILACVGAIVGLVWLVYGNEVRQTRPPESDRARLDFTWGLQDESEILAQREQLQVRHAAALSGQVEASEQGFHAVPVEQAMRHIAGSGLPTWHEQGLPDTAAAAAMRQAFKGAWEDSE